MVKPYLCAELSAKSQVVDLPSKSKLDLLIKSNSYKPVMLLDKTVQLRGELTEAEANQEAGNILADPDVKRGAPVGNQNAAKDKENNSTNYRIESSQPARAESNKVGIVTQRKLDRLAKDRPDLLDKVRSGERFSGNHRRG